MANLFDVEKPRSDTGPIPPNTVAPMLLRVKRGPDGGILTPSSASDGRYLNCEIKVTDGPFKGNGFFPRWTVEGPEAGHQQAKEISYALIGSIVRSALGLTSTDASPEARAKLVNFDFENLDGLRFIGRTGRTSAASSAIRVWVNTATSTTTRRPSPVESLPT